MDSIPGGNQGFCGKTQVQIPVVACRVFDDSLEISGVYIQHGYLGISIR